MFTFTLDRRNNILMAPHVVPPCLWKDALQCFASQQPACTLVRQQLCYDYCHVHLSAFHECRIDLMAVEEK